MEIRQLKYFITLAEMQNFTKASKAMFITQPTLSQQIQALESELCVELFTRSNRGVILTDAGQVLYQEAGKVMRQYEKCIQVMEDYRDTYNNIIKIGTLFAIEPSFFPKLVSRFSRKYPMMELQYSSHSFKDLFRMLETGELNMSVCLGYQNELPANIESFRFNSDKMVLVFPKNMEIRRPDSFDDPVIADILKLPVYLFSEWHSYEKELALIKSYVPELQIRYYNNVNDFFYHSMSTPCYTILPKRYLDSFDVYQWIQTLALPEELGNLDVLIAYNKDFVTPGVTLLYEETLEFFKDETYENTFVRV